MIVDFFFFNGPNTHARTHARSRFKCQKKKKASGKPVNIAAPDPRRTFSPPPSPTFPYDRSTVCGPPPSRNRHDVFFFFHIRFRYVFRFFLFSRPQEVPVQVTLQRKKSLPDVQLPLNAPASITREEVSVLSSARREEMRRVEEENERLRANPLLYLTSPHMKVRAYTYHTAAVDVLSPVYRPPLRFSAVPWWHEGRGGAFFSVTRWLWYGVSHFQGLSKNVTRNQKTYLKPL